nr:hypothetical protein L203_06128 [Cryptococcus depauperatus CBS 7841]
MNTRKRKQQRKRNKCDTDALITLIQVANVLSLAASSKCQSPKDTADVALAHIEITAGFSASTHHVITAPMPTSVWIAKRINRQKTVAYYVSLSTIDRMVLPCCTSQSPYCLKTVSRDRKPRLQTATASRDYCFSTYKTTFLDTQTNNLSQRCIKNNSQLAFRQATVFHRRTLSPNTPYNDLVDKHHANCFHPSMLTTALCSKVYPSARQLPKLGLRLGGLETRRAQICLAKVDKEASIPVSAAVDPTLPYPQLSSPLPICKAVEDRRVPVIRPMPSAQSIPCSPSVK